MFSKELVREGVVIRVTAKESKDDNEEEEDDEEDEEDDDNVNE